MSLTVRVTVARKAKRGMLGLLWMALCTAVSAAPASTAPALPESLPHLYARYLAQGRSDVEIHLSAAGAHASARTRAMADGSHSCHVSGLRLAGQGPAGDNGRLQLAALLVHEVTHCLVAPHVPALHSAAADGLALLNADRLLLLSAESISDARAVIEVFRHDGGAAAQALVALMLPQRLSPSSFGHSTALALRAALTLTQTQPQTLQTPAMAFAMALQIGRDSALQTLSDKLLAEGRHDLLSHSHFTQVVAALDSALLQARRAFDNGRFANNAFTLRVSNDRASAADQHVFIDAGGGLRRIAALSAEGAHSLPALQALLAASPAPEHQLASQWLQCQGRLDTHSLAHLSPIMGRFLRAVSDGSFAQRERATQVLGSMISQGRCSADVSSLLDDAAVQIRLAIVQ
ncbi:MAG: hypothetical protein Q8L92_13965 [Rubrivivax sp.]|nr:hypothetical protein [Rubrivivax sp.]